MSLYGGSEARLIKLKDLLDHAGKVKEKLKSGKHIYFHGFLFGPDYAKLKFPPIEYNKLVPDNRIQTDNSSCVHQFTFERDEENGGTLPVCFDAQGNQLDERFWISGSGAPTYTGRIVRGGTSRRRNKKSSTIRKRRY